LKNKQTTPETQKDNSALFTAVENNDIKTVKNLVAEKEIDVNIYDPTNDFTPLHIAVARDYLEMTKLLLASQANPNAQDGEGNTPLHFAAEGNNLKLLKCLVKNKYEDLNVEVKADNGFTISDVFWQKDYSYAKIYEDLVEKYKTSAEIQFNQQEDYEQLLELAVRKIYSLKVKETATSRRQKFQQAQQLFQGIRRLVEEKVTAKTYLTRGEIEEEERAEYEKKSKYNENNDWEYLSLIEDTNIITNAIYEQKLDKSLLATIKKETNIQYVDESVEEEGVHAEMKILATLHTRGKLSKRGGLSPFQVCGTHGSTYMNWMVPNNIPDRYKAQLLSELEKLLLPKKVGESTSVIPPLLTKSHYRELEQEVEYESQVEVGASLPVNDYGGGLSREDMIGSFMTQLLMVEARRQLDKGKKFRSRVKSVKLRDDYIEIEFEDSDLIEIDLERMNGMQIDILKRQHSNVVKLIERKSKSLEELKSENQQQAKEIEKLKAALDSEKQTKTKLVEELNKIITKNFESMKQETQILIDPK
ncbi:12197_t:CDS:2, partial [Racocetra persica]